jgi:uncharacterized protein
VRRSRLRAPVIVVVLTTVVIGCSPERSATQTSPAARFSTPPASESPGADSTQLDRELIDAAWDNDVDRAGALIRDGADVNAKDDTAQSAFLIAASEGHRELLELTLDSGADVTSLDSYNGTALIRAAERGHADIVERLLQTRINVNHVNNLGWTALLEAVILGDGSERYVKVVRMLLDAGADPDIADRDGVTALEHAQRRDQTTIVAELQR